MYVTKHIRMIETEFPGLSRSKYKYSSDYTSFKVVESYHDSGFDSEPELEEHTSTIQDI